MELLQRYTPSARWFHWLYAVVFFELAVSGLLLALPWFGPTALGTWIRLTHRISAVIFVLAPAIFVLLSRQRAASFVKEAFTWRKEDLAWFKAAPGYYFGGDPKLMPPQGYINTGMKSYRLAILFGAVVFLVTGLIMWFFKGIVAPAVFQWSVVVHGLTFILAVCTFFLHFQLGVLHPRMDESLLSMIDGKVSGVYAKSHHGKWHDEISKKKDSSATLMARAEASTRTDGG